MTLRGRDSADAIARSALLDAVAEAGSCLSAPGCPPDLARRFEAIARTADRMSCADASLPRRVGISAVAVLRVAGASLRAACCALPEPGGRDGIHAASVALHQALDTAATALGGAPDCFDDADDWRIPDEDGTVDMSRFASTAATAVLVSRGLDDLVGVTRGGTALIRQDAACLVAGAMALRVACLEPAGVPAPLVEDLATRTAACVDRIRTAAASWYAVDPDGPVGRVSDALEAAGRLAADVIEDLDASRAPAPGW